ncbi:MAG: phosphatase PAP2 family protein [Proteobacteria bacterium]|nr:phosphatase PAP2 family protein [Pseudomonadota bacterium]
MIHFKALWCLGLCILFWFISPRDSKAESISLYFMLVFFSFTFWLPILANLPYSPLPTQDHLMALIESPIKGLYITLVDFINKNQLYQSVALFFYNSVQYYLILGVIYAFIFEHANIKKYVFIFLLCILFGTIISYLLPVISPIVSYGKSHYNDYMVNLFNHYIAMRNGANLVIYDEVSMPSWHYLFVLCSMTLVTQGIAKYVYRLYGVIILISVVLLGCHYLADIAASITLFLLISSLSRKLETNIKPFKMEKI